MSSDARTHVLTRIRRSLNRGELPEETRAALDRRIADSKPGVVPARATGDHAALVERFVEMAELAAATISRVPGMEAVPGAVADWLKGHNLAPRVVAAPMLRWTPWRGTASWRSRGAWLTPPIRSRSRLASPVWRKPGLLCSFRAPNIPQALTSCPITTSSFCALVKWWGGMKRFGPRYGRKGELPGL